MMEKLADDDRIEQMSAQRRRMRQQEHARAVQKMIDDRKEQHARDKVRMRSRAITCETERLKHFFLNICMNFTRFFVCCKCVLVLDKPSIVGPQPTDYSNVQSPEHPINGFLGLYVFFFTQLAEQERLLAQREQEAEMQRIVEEERQKILQEHAKKLLGYLPKVRELQS